MVSADLPMQLLDGCLFPQLATGTIDLALLFQDNEFVAVVVVVAVAVAVVVVVVVLLEIS